MTERRSRSCEALKITVRLFAVYREKAGRAELEMDLPDGATVGCLAARLASLHPSITREPSKLAVAVNQEFSEHGQALKEGDEVAVIPPVSGGQHSARSGL